VHHVTIDDWSRKSSFLHRRDARAKLIALLALLVGLSASGRNTVVACALMFVLLGLLTYIARLPLLPVLWKSALILPFCAVFAFASLLAGDRAGAIRLVARSYVSGFAALLFISTTPLPLFLRGLEKLRAPRFLLTVMQFLYRYLFLLSEEGQHMRAAALSRGGLQGKRGFHAAAGALSVLFARSYARAGQIHHAMLSRGYNGSLPVYYDAGIDMADVLLVCAAVAFAIAVLAGAGR
jgi:cobalt/nickel transport system permease protein